jgi:2-amino-4-hydroxy-6-hydroxymethyldihydropteridine diphosphokinase
MPPSTTDGTVSAYIGLGANLGDTRATLDSALAELAALPDSALVAVSPRYRSAPVDATGPDYTNAVAVISTRLCAGELLAALQRIEAAHGRERPYRNAPRRLDLDVLLYGEQRIETAHLSVPHPRLHERAFVLRPLADLAPELVVPGRGPVGHLLAAVAGQRIERIDA